MTLIDKVTIIVERSLPVGVRVAAEAVRFVLPIFERHFPSDNSPRIAVEAAERWARSPTRKNYEDARACAAPVANARDTAHANANADANANPFAAWAARTDNGTAWSAWAVTNAAIDVAVSTRRNVSAAVAYAIWAADEQTVHDHLIESDWLIDYNWAEVINAPRLRLMVPQFPYTHGPFRLWIKGVESCWTLAELRARRQSRTTHTILVAIDAAMEGTRT